MAGPVGYAQCSERILTFSSLIGIKFYPHTHLVCEVLLAVMKTYGRGMDAR